MNNVKNFKNINQVKIKKILHVKKYIKLMRKCFFTLMFFVLKSYAKLNLFLSLKGKNNSSGYHEISTLMTYIDLYDIIHVKSKTRGSGVDLSFSGKYGYKMQNNVFSEKKDNLIIKVLDIVAKKYGVSIDLDVNLEKNIPFPSGLGGGSSNAASMINFCDKFYGLEMSMNEKIEIAKSVGFDVPFFLYGKTALCSGFGEKVEPVLIDETEMNSYSVLLINSNEKISTRDVYESYDAMNLSNDECEIVNFENDKAALKLQTMSRLGFESSLFNVISNKNDNHLTSTNPNVMKFSKEIISYAKSIDGDSEIVYSGISGGGSCGYILYRDQYEARSAMTIINQKYPSVKCSITKMICHLNGMPKALKISGMYLASA